MQLPELARAPPVSPRGRGESPGAPAWKPARLQRLPHLTGLARLVELLAILDQLARSRSETVASVGFVPRLSTDDQERMQRVIAYIHARLETSIDRAAVAGWPFERRRFQSFLQTPHRKTLPEYVNELRPRLPIAGQRARQSDGHRVAMRLRQPGKFQPPVREITRMSPRDYRRQLRRSAAPPDAG